jgi:uncharacterized membrane protein
MIVHIILILGAIWLVGVLLTSLGIALSGFNTEHPRRERERTAWTASFWIWWTGVILVGVLLLWAVGRM